MTQEQVEGLRRNRLQGLLNFVEYFVDKRGLSEVLFEPRLKRLLDGLKRW